MARDYPDRPIIGVAAVVIEDDRTVLVRRGKPPAYGDWSLPGGAVELGETLEEALLREVEEEIGLQVDAVELIAVLDRVFLDRGGRVQYHYVLLDFLCRRTGGRMQASSDVLSCVQVPCAALSRYRLTQETREVINRAYQRLSGAAPPIYKARTHTRFQP